MCDDEATPITVKGVFATRSYIYVPINHDDSPLPLNVIELSGALNECARSIVPAGTHIFIYIYILTNYFPGSEGYPLYTVTYLIYI